MIQLHHGDCLDIMRDIPDESIDMILCDPPYGTTKCSWDNVIPFTPMWEQYRRIIKKNGAILLFGSEPFASQLRVSNLKHFRYDWIWEKEQGIGFANANKMPMKSHEIVSVFYEKLPTYNPQGLRPCSKKVSRDTKQGKDSGKYLGKNGVDGTSYVRTSTNYPKSVLRFSRAAKGKHHPTEKPVELAEYLIRTYTNEGETVLDNCMGSGTTGIACVNTNRKFIGIEKENEEEPFFDIARQRIAEAKLGDML
jgi:DNA modification methylase